MYTKYNIQDRKSKQNKRQNKSYLEDGASNSQITNLKNSRISSKSKTLIYGIIIMQIQRLMAESRSTQKTFCIHISVQGEQLKISILVFKKLIE